MLKQSILSILQRAGKAFMLPIALLPAAGMLLGIGGAFTNTQMIEAYQLNQFLGSGTILNALLTIFKDTGEIIFANLGLLFSIGLAIGFAKADKGTAGLAGAVGFLIMHKAINSTLSIQNITANTTTVEFLSQTMNIVDATAKSQEYTHTLGIFTLQISVLGGLISGLFSAYLHNKYYNIQLPQCLAFFGGSRFVPIITTIVMLFVGILLTFIWPVVSYGVSLLGILVEKTGYFGTFMYGSIKRLFIPVGLHHVFYMPFWQTAIGGTMEIGGKIVTGAQNIFFAQLADSNTTHFSVKGTRFFSGEFVFMIFGLPGAALAMYHTSKSEQKTKISSLLISAALTSFLTGITEPIEFTFLFVAPILYYAVHVPLCGLSYMLMHMLDVGVGLTFSGGFIDLLLFGIIQGQEKTNWLMIPLIGIFYSIIYYFIFKFIIIKFNLKTPGREDESENEDILNLTSFNKDIQSISMKVLEGLGGKENIEYIDACASRLRITVKDLVRIKQENYFKQIGARGITNKKNSIQIIFGGSSDNIKTEIEKIIEGI